MQCFSHSEGERKRGPVIFFAVDFPMCVENLTYPEYYYFRTDPDYKCAVLIRLKELGKPLRVPSEDDSRFGVSAYMQTMSFVKGSAKGRSEKRQHRFKTWHRKDFLKQNEEIYA